MRVDVRIVPVARTADGKIAEAELHFSEAPLEGMKLVGFGVWEPTPGKGRNVTFPSRNYTLNNARRTFSLLRPIADVDAGRAVRELVLAAYAAWEATR